MQKFVDKSAGRSRQDSGVATNFLQEQLEKYEAKLKESERGLAEFKRDNQTTLPNGSSYYSTVVDTQGKIADLDVLIAEKTAEIDGRRGRFLPNGGGEAVQNIVSTSYDSRLNEMQNVLDQMRVKYTDKHPSIIQLKENIEGIKTLRLKEQNDIIKRASQGALAFSNDNNKNESTAVQDFAMIMNQLESERDALLARREKMVEKYEHLNNEMSNMPEIEARLAGLHRDYTVSYTHLTLPTNREV